MHAEAKATWKSAKKALTAASPGLFKWWVNARFQGHHRESVTKCKCPEQATVTQAHILGYQEYQACFDATAAHSNMTVEKVQRQIGSRDPEASTREEFETLNEVEDHLSAQLLAKISGMERPARARQ